MLKLSKYPPRGFTLIELLVVVLIIGILAAIALPQYKQVVLKSKLAKVKSNVQALASAMERYYMTNNAYPDNLRTLDIEVLSTPKENYYTNGHGDIGCNIFNSNGGYMLNYYTILHNSTYHNYYGQNINKNVYYCIAYDYNNDNSILHKVCKTDTGKTEHIYRNATYTWYAY